MQTAIAYAFDRAVDPAAVEQGLRRVEAHYASGWAGLAQRRGLDAESVGVHVWDRVDPSCRWPSWWTDPDLAVVSLYAPLGYPAVVGDLPPHQAVGPLARALLARPERMLELTPPFVLIGLAAAEGRLDLLTDAMGVGRLFQLRTRVGWVWSNRPAAACLFAGVWAAPDARAWRYRAACAWSMDDSTPFEGVLAIPGAARVTYQARSRVRTLTRIDAASLWGSWHTGDPGGEAPLLEEAAAALQTTARSVGHLWPGRPTVDLSGGRDSRVVAAAFLSAGVDVRLNSYDVAPGEADVAARLVATLPFPVDHVVRRQGRLAGQSAGSPGDVRPEQVQVVEQVRAWHRFAEGLRPASYIWHTPPEDLASVSELVIGGVGGEIAHGHFYPPDVLRIDALPIDERLSTHAARLTDRLVAAVGPSQRARDAVAAQVLRVLREAVAGGMEDGTVLDYFWVAERLRRWAGTGERVGLVSPLLGTAFARAAFALTPQQRIENTLHRALLRQLVPQWADVPFVAGSSPDQTGSLRRLGAAADRDQVGGLLSDVTTWGRDFDARAVRRLWRYSRSGLTRHADEMVLWRVTWQAVFVDHLADVNRHLPTGAASGVGRPVAVPPGTQSARSGQPAPKAPARRLADVRLARRLADTGPGRRLTGGAWGRRLLARR